MSLSSVGHDGIDQATEPVSSRVDTSADRQLLRFRAVPFEIEFYEDETGTKPCLDWIRNLDVRSRRVPGTALREILQQQGVTVCGSSYGKQLGEGLFEFRLREGDLLFRIFCHAYGARIVLLLSGYDKGADPSKRRQQREIERARRLLTAWKQRG